VTSETSDALSVLIDLPSEASDFRSDVLDGLGQAQKSIPPKYFYDAVGAKLFEAICETPEYYVTRAETALLEQIAPEVAAWAGKGASLIEPGSGAATKARLLLSAMGAPAEYILFDISHEQLKAAGRSINADYPKLRVGAVSGDFTQAMPAPNDVFVGGGKRLCFFPGSTIGNFAPDRQITLLKSFKTLLRKGDAILLGADTIKDEDVLNAAYNDQQGLTAQFNLNLLARLQNELGAKLDAAAFQHHAFFNTELARIEMHLSAPNGAEIEIDGDRFALKPNETIHTENSWKFDRMRLSTLAEAAGLSVSAVWNAENDAFMTALLEV